MRRLTVFTCVCTLLFAMTLSVYASPNEDFMYCIQQGECGIEYVCDYNMRDVEASGTILRIVSNMDYPVLAKWTAISNSGGVPTEHPMRVEAHSSRLFRTTGQGAGTVRLLIEDEIVDMITTGRNGAPECPAHLACQYLLLACYNAIDDGACDTATDYCGSVLGPATAHPREACIPSCLVTYYGEELENWQGDPYRGLESESFHTYTPRESETEHSRYQTTGLSHANTEGARYSTISDGERELVTCVADTLGMSPVEGYDVPLVGNCDSDSNGGLIAAIVLLALACLALLAILAYQYYRRRNLQTFGMGSSVNTIPL